MAASWPQARRVRRSKLLLSGLGRPKGEEQASEVQVRFLGEWGLEQEGCEVLAQVDVSSRFAASDVIGFDPLQTLVGGSSPAAFEAVPLIQ
jgi:hypothetical protein